MLTASFAAGGGNKGINVSDIDSLWVRSIYLTHLLAMFTRNSCGTYIKPSEGISAQAHGIIKKNLGRGGFWLWLCNTIPTDRALSNKKSYVYGAVFVSQMLDSATFKKRYPSRRAMAEFRYSKDCKFQMIIPMNPRCRLMLRKPVEVDQYDPQVQRLGAWEMAKGSEMHRRLQAAKFKRQV